VTNFTRVGQPDNSFSNLAATELVDPPGIDSTVTPSCPPEKLCRFSDAALIRVDNDTTRFGFIPTVGTSSPFSISGYKSIITTDGHVDPTMGDSIPGESFGYNGMNIKVTGQATGMHAGIITRTCIDTPYPDEDGVVRNKMLLCQFLSTLNTGEGDSGAPVYRMSGPDDDYVSPLLGIHWGKTPDDTGQRREAFSPYYFVDIEIYNATGKHISAARGF